MHRSDSERGNRWFVPLLPGTTVRDRALVCLGALFGIVLLGVAAKLASTELRGETWMLAPVGASAVLVFAVPTSPLAQPWPVIGGSTISAFIGLIALRLLGSDPLAAGLAVGVAIAVMTVARCLHPPGGAAALTAVLAGSTDTDVGTLFPVIPILLDALAIVAIAWVFHRLVTGHSYPHKPGLKPSAPTTAASLAHGFTSEDVDAVLERLGNSYDISRDDLEAILDAVETEAFMRETSEHLTVPR